MQFNDSLEIYYNKYKDGPFGVPQHLINTFIDCKGYFSPNVLKMLELSKIAGEEESKLDIKYIISIETDPTSLPELSVYVAPPNFMYGNKKEGMNIFTSISTIINSLAPEACKVISVGKHGFINTNSFDITVACSFFVCTNRNMATTVMTRYDLSSLVFASALGISQETFFSIPYLIAAFGASICHQA